VASDLNSVDELQEWDPGVCYPHYPPSKHLPAANATELPEFVQLGTRTKPTFSWCGGNGQGPMGSPVLSTAAHTTSCHWL